MDSASRPWGFREESEAPEPACAHPRGRNTVPQAGQSPDELLSRAVAAARAGAELAVRHRAGGIGEIGTKSTQTDVVTAADHAVEELLARLLLDGHPHDHLL